jgi:hypothetical protein
MARQTLPFTMTTGTGTRWEFEFPLHAETVSAMRVSQLLTELLATVDREIKVLGPTANGDVLQAMAMALAARAVMIEAAPSTTLRLAHDLYDDAAAAASDGKRVVAQAGHA